MRLPWQKSKDFPTLLHITADGSWKIDLNEEITKGCVITKEGEIVHAKVKETVK